MDEHLDKHRDEQLDEHSLIGRAQAGDQVAFRTLYDNHVDRVFRVTYRMTGNEETARECTQETFVRAFNRLSDFRGDAKFSTWLHSIGVNMALNALRSRKRSREVGLDNVGLDNVGSDNNVAWMGRSGGDPTIRDRIKQAVDGLPEHFRTVFLMHDLEGYKHTEIAASLDVAVGTSKARLSRARAALRAALGDELREYVS